MTFKLKTLQVVLFLASSCIHGQYIPYPEPTHMNFPPPYINPSINDPLFYANRLFPFKKGFGNDKRYKQACKILGGDIYYDHFKNIYINKATGAYYNPNTGLIYNKQEKNVKQVIDGAVGPNPAVTKRPPKNPSDKIYLPNELKKFDLPYYAEQKKCNNCDHTGKCQDCDNKNFNGCGKCWEGQQGKACEKCFNYQCIKNEVYKGMAYKILLLLNEYREYIGIESVGYNKELYYTALAQDLYMAHRGSLSNDNFMANVATHAAGTQTTAYINSHQLSDDQGAKEFISMWKLSHEQNNNLLNRKINQCAAAVFFDEKASRYYATLLCVKM